MAGVFMNLGSGDAAEMLKDKKLDVVAATSGLTTIETYMLPLETEVGLKIVRLDDDVIHQIVAKYPGAYAPVTIKGGTYKHEQEDIKWIGSSMCMVISIKIFRMNIILPKNWTVV